MNNIHTNFTSMGIGLIIVGTIFALVSWQLLNHVPMVALSTGTIVLGIVSIGLGNTIPKLSPEASLIFLEAGMDNITSIIEELGLKSKAIYLPSRMTDGLPKALIPLFSDKTSPTDLPKLENRFLVLLDKKTNNYGILIVTPGSATVKALRTSTITDGIALEEALRSVLIANLDLANRAICTQSDQMITIELSGVVLDAKSHPAYETMGSPVTSICAAVTAEVLNSPITLGSEEQWGGKISIKLLLSQIP